MAESEAKAAPKKKKKEGFFSGVKKEWNKIIWVPKEDVGRETGLVVVISLITGIIITVIDSGALHLIDWILSLG